MIKIFRKTIRPFSKSAEIRCRGYSLPLQRVMTDFGAEESFFHATERIKEHYGIEIPASAVASTTENHAKQMFDNQVVCNEISDEPGVDVIVAETDGSMVPIVEIDGSKRGDKRKSRSVKWKEARLCLVRVWNTVSPLFRATMGSVDDVGDLLLDASIEAGMGIKTKIHGVGDGAKWIRDQFERVFSTHATYLLDFYHVCDYLFSAAKGAFPSDSQAWYETNKKRLRRNHHKAVIKDLAKHIEGTNLPDEQAPVRACHRYLSSRKDQLDYKGALTAGLPIGSGEIESSHRFVIQERLKIPGAWWTEDNAAYMLALRVVRSNGKWDNYWEGLKCPDEEKLAA